MPEKFLTVKEVAALLRLTERTIYEMCKSGDLPAFRIRGGWRFKETLIMAWVDAQANVPIRAVR